MSLSTQASSFTAGEPHHASANIEHSHEAVHHGVTQDVRALAAVGDTKQTDKGAITIINWVVTLNQIGLVGVEGMSADHNTKVWHRSIARRIICARKDVVEGVGHSSCECIGDIWTHQ